MNLVIVESPTKSKTIQKFLKSGHKVVPSYGHVRDLPKTKIGIDAENDFEPQYVVTPKAKKTIGEIKRLVEKSDKIMLATDPDREGEAISWHLVQALKIKEGKYQRIIFHEVTEPAIRESLKNPRNIDLNLVNAQQARRILDRIVGYKLSPLLWKKVVRGLSAGRVQSVAVRFIVDREREIEAFKEREYWTIEANFKAEGDSLEFPAQLVEIGPEKIGKFFISEKAAAEKISQELKGQSFFISSIKNKKAKKNPLPPFITSTLQQEAYNKLRLSSKATMRIAQQLYEKGFTTYHRTDSYNLSALSVSQAKNFIIKEYGEKYWEGRKYSARKGAQEAHEAIRPAYPEQMPKSIANKLDKRQFALYDLIWRRFIASLMPPAIMDQTTAEIKTKPGDFTLRSSGQILRFDGFLKIYPLKFKEKTLPLLKEKQSLLLLDIIPSQHFTQPPPRYTEATLIKAMEEKGIGRPSTYAPTISTIQEREYVKKNEDKKLYPTEMGALVNDLLAKHFPKIIDTGFTADMEKNLDDIAEGKIEWKSVIRSFYKPFDDLIKKKEKEIDKKELTEKETDEICEKCGSKMVLKMGRYGRFLACSNYPECKNAKPIKEEVSEEPCEKCGGKMVLKKSKFGEFWGCSNYPECKNIKKDEKDTGITCPECKQGKIVVKKSKKGKPFYGCSRYPECGFASNKKPEQSA